MLGFADGFSVGNTNGLAEGMEVNTSTETLILTVSRSGMDIAGDKLGTSVDGLLLGSPLTTLGGSLCSLDTTEEAADGADEAPTVGEALVESVLGAPVSSSKGRLKTGTNGILIDNLSRLSTRKFLRFGSVL